MCVTGAAAELFSRPKWVFIFAVVVPSFAAPANLPLMLYSADRILPDFLISSGLFSL